MANLSEAERAQMKAAHDKAIQQNPELDQKIKAAHQAMEEARKSMHDAMVAVDPSIEPILAKMMPPKWGGKYGGGPRGPGGQGASSVASRAAADANASQQQGPRKPAGMAALTESERQKLKSLHDQVKNDPTVIAAKQANQVARNPEGRHAAEEALHQAIYAAMIKADPSIEPILSKLHPEGSGNAEQPPAPPSSEPMAP
jgi:hypothetical protein